VSGGFPSAPMKIDITVYTPGTDTVNVHNVEDVYLSNSSAQTVKYFTNGEEGQIIYLHFADGNTTIDRTTCFLAGGTNFTGTANDVLVLKKKGSSWEEVSRSVNS
jgi:hypothetical protein